MKNFSIAIQNDAEFRIVRDVMLERGIPVYGATARATGMDGYAILGWNAGEVCRSQMAKEKHYTSGIEFMAELASPNRGEKVALREKIAVVEAQLAALNSELAALS